MSLTGVSFQALEANEYEEEKKKKIKIMREVTKKLMLYLFISFRIKSLTFFYKSKRER